MNSYYIDQQIFLIKKLPAQNKLIETSNISLRVIKFCVLFVNMLVQIIYNTHSCVLIYIYIYMKLCFEFLIILTTLLLRSITASCAPQIIDSPEGCYPGEKSRPISKNNVALTIHICYGCNFSVVVSDSKTLNSLLLFSDQ